MKAISKGERLKNIAGMVDAGVHKIIIGKEWNALYPKPELRMKQVKAGTPSGRLPSGWPIRSESSPMPKACTTNVHGIENGGRKLFFFIVNMAIKAALTWITDRRTFVAMMNAGAAQQCVRQVCFIVLINEVWQ